MTGAALSAGIPYLSGLSGGALVVPCGIDETLEIVGRAPVEGVFRSAVIHPVGVVVARNPDRVQPALLPPIAGQHAIIARLIHADVEGPAANAGVVDGKDDGCDEIVEMHEVALQR